MCCSSAVLESRFASYAQQHAGCDGQIASRFGSFALLGRGTAWALSATIAECFRNW